MTLSELVSMVEVLDPMVLGSKVRPVCECKCQESGVQLPMSIVKQFDEDLVISGEQKRLYVTLGQFSIIRMERDAQLIVPVLDYAIPTKECCDAPGSAEDPCEMFSRIPFPTGQFTPSGCDREQGDGPCCAYKTT